MSNPHVRLHVADGVATLTLCNPDMNRLSRDLLSGLFDSIPALQSPEVRAVLLVADGAALMGFMEPSLAIPPLAGGPQRIAARAGVSRALEITTSGRLYEAEQFERWNIVSRVVPAESLRPEAAAFAAKLAIGPTLAYGAVKTLLRRYETEGIVGADRVTASTVVPVLNSRDASTAITALMTGKLGKEPLVCAGE